MITKANKTRDVFEAQCANVNAVHCRFVAVTRPLRYAKQKGCGRAYLSLIALTWIISIAVSSPIALGINYTEQRRLTPTSCTFYNSDFLIWSSMASFYIPCIVMLILYCRMFRSIRQMARRYVRFKPCSLAQLRQLFHTANVHVVACDSPPPIAISMDLHGVYFCNLKVYFCHLVISFESAGQCHRVKVKVNAVEKLKTQVVRL